jgi:hypothetical protein
MDMRRKAELIAGGRSGIRLRQGVVTAATGSLATIKVAGSDVELTDVVCLAHVSPEADDVVFLLTDGLDLIVIGKL